MRTLVEIAPEDPDELDFNYPYSVMAEMRDVIMEATTILDTDFPEDAPHLCIFRIPVGEHGC